MNKILIIGGPGTGKTVLSIFLKELYSFPVYHLDDIEFKDNWKKKNKLIVKQKILSVLKNENWIIEGNYLENLDYILRDADFVIFLDFNVFSQLSGIFKRFFSNFNQCIKNIKNCKEKISFSFFIKTILFNIKKKPKIIKKVMKYSSYRLFFLVNRNQVNEWIETLKSK